MTTLRTALNSLKINDSEYTTRVKNVFRGRVKKLGGRTLEEKLTEHNLEVFAHILVAQVLYGTEWPMPNLENIKAELQNHIGKYLKFLPVQKIFLDIHFVDGLEGETLDLKYLAFHNAPWWTPTQVRCNRSVLTGKMIGLPIYCDKDFTEHSVVGDLSHIRYITHVSFRDPVKHNFEVIMSLQTDELDLDALDNLDVPEPDIEYRTESEAEAEDGGCEGGACKI